MLQPDYCSTALLETMLAAAYLFSYHIRQFQGNLMSIFKDPHIITGDIID